jgi:hypothetical protein
MPCSCPFYARQRQAREQTKPLAVTVRVKAAQPGSTGVGGEGMNGWRLFWSEKSFPAGGDFTRSRRLNRVLLCICCIAFKKLTVLSCITNGRRGQASGSTGRHVLTCHRSGSQSPPPPLCPQSSTFPGSCGAALHLKGFPPQRCSLGAVGTPTEATHQERRVPANPAADTAQRGVQRSHIRVLLLIVSLLSVPIPRVPSLVAASWVGTSGVGPRLLRRRRRLAVGLLRCRAIRRRRPRSRGGASVRRSWRGSIAARSGVGGRGGIGRGGGGGGGAVVASCWGLLRISAISLQLAAAVQDRDQQPHIAHRSKQPAPRRVG